MNAYISSDINMVKELDPKRHELALLQADWLETASGVPKMIPQTLCAIFIGLSCHGLPQLIQWGIEKWMM